MDELDLLKTHWKKDETSFEQVSEKQIYKMIHKSSSSIVKWIFIISILEFLLWSVLSFFMKDGEVMRQFDAYHVEHIMTPFMIIGYIGLAYFFYQFYMNYKKISATDNVQKLINTILKTRKKVHQYVWFNIIYAVISAIIIVFIQINYDQRIIKLLETSGKNNNAVIIYVIYIGITVAFLAIFIGFIWIFYRLIYGILLKRLYKNYEELKKIDY
jgi:Kef-type K+ transport system membrane component KefB